MKSSATSYRNSGGKRVTLLDVCLRLPHGVHGQLSLILSDAEAVLGGRWAKARRMP